MFHGHSNLTETTPKIVARRASYVATHTEYFYYLLYLLDTATLPASDTPLPNLTTMAAMVAELRAMHPAAPWLNGVVLGRLLHRVLPPPLLTWHGSRHAAYSLPCGLPIYVATTVYRFPEVLRARQSFERFIGEKAAWSNDVDQWRVSTDFQGAAKIDGHLLA
jgi:hypothetical protein